MNTIDPYEPYLNLLIGSMHVIKAVDCDLYVSLAQENEFDIPLPGGGYENVKEYIGLSWHDNIDTALRPLRDDFKEALLIAELVALRIRQGQKVLIVCGAGNNRSGLVGALAMIKLGVSVEETIQKFKNLRDSALTNQAFLDFIRREAE